MTLEIYDSDGKLLYVVPAIDIKVSDGVVEGRLGAGSFRLVGNPDVQFDDKPIRATEVSVEDGEALITTTLGVDVVLSTVQVTELTPPFKCPLGICKKE